MGAWKSCDVCRISIHALLAESDQKNQHQRKRKDISIHALLAESDSNKRRKGSNDSGFLSTLSLRRATSQQPLGTTRTTYFYPRSPCGERRKTQTFKIAPLSISIHALLAESDANGCTTVPNFGYFYPRSPCGERRKPRRLKSRR